MSNFSKKKEHENEFCSSVIWPYPTTDPNNYETAAELVAPAFLNVPWPCNTDLLKLGKRKHKVELVIH
jgi:hypothetical protein